MPRKLLASLSVQTTALDPQKDYPYGAFYQVTYQTFAKGTPIRSVVLPLADTERTAWDRVVEIWRSPGRDPKPRAGGTREIAKEVRIELGGTAAIAELDGPATIDAIYLRVDSADPAVLHSTLLKIHWDDEKGEAADCPVGDFFGNGFARVPYGSLVMGLDEEGWYTISSPCRFRSTVPCDSLMRAWGGRLPRRRG